MVGMPRDPQFEPVDTPHPTTRVEFDGGFGMDLPIRLRVDDDPRDGYTTCIIYDWSPTGPRVREVSVTSDIGPVNGEVLREVRVAELGRENLHRITRRHGEPVIPPRTEVDERAEAGVKSGQTLMLVRTLYQYAELTGLPPAKFISETLAISIATAGRWIRRSKDALQWGSDDG